MATRYRLPDKLGGSEVTGEVVTTGVAVGVGSIPILLTHVENIGWITVPMSALTEVLPPEPPYLSIVLLTDGNPFWRRDIHWWQSLATGTDYSWEQVCAKGKPVLLVPDPLAEAPELPWEHQFTDGGPLKVHVSSASNRAAFVEGWGHLTAQEARNMGLALLRAAAEQEAAMNDG